MPSQPRLVIVVCDTVGTPKSPDPNKWWKIRTAEVSHITATESRFELKDPKGATTAVLAIISTDVPSVVVPAMRLAEITVNARNYLLAETYDLKDLEITSEFSINKTTGNAAAKMVFVMEEYSSDTLPMMTPQEAREQRMMWH